MKQISLIFIFFVIILFIFNCPTQQSSSGGGSGGKNTPGTIPGTLDTSFDPGDGPDNTVYAIAIQPDKKILIGGTFTTYNSTPINRIARLNPDGSLDTSFNNQGSGLNNTVYTIVLQPDGKILVGGFFTEYNGTSRNRIARLNEDGTLDTTFNPGTGATGSLTNDDWVYAITLQSNNEILVGGTFTKYNNVPVKYIVRINTYGVFDSNFNLGGSGADNEILSISVQSSDGKILIGGDFTEYNGISRTRIARLDNDGGLDTSFNPGTGVSGDVHSIVVQPDNKILIVGKFIYFNGETRKYIARLEDTGVLDTTFDPGEGAYRSIFSIGLQTNGKIIIGGFFSKYNNDDRIKFITRLEDNGLLDTSFNPEGTFADDTIWRLALQPDGKILIGGKFTEYNGVTRNRIARIFGN